MARSKQFKQTSVERRRFLQQSALVGAAFVGVPDAQAAAQAPPPASTPAAAPQPQVPSTPVMTLAAEAVEPGDVQVLGENERAGSDFMVDVIKTLGFEYICENPGSSFRGIHDSLVSYESGRQQNPEIILCCHEEIAVSVAHGYAKIGRAHV